MAGESGCNSPRLCCAEATTALGKGRACIQLPPPRPSCRCLRGRAHRAHRWGQRSQQRTYNSRQRNCRLENQSREGRDGKSPRKRWIPPWLWSSSQHHSEARTRQSRWSAQICRQRMESRSLLLRLRRRCLLCKACRLLLPPGSTSPQSLPVGSSSCRRKHKGSVYHAVPSDRTMQDVPHVPGDFPLTAFESSVLGATSNPAGSCA